MSRRRDEPTCPIARRQLRIRVAARARCEDRRQSPPFRMDRALVTQCASSRASCAGIRSGGGTAWRSVVRRRGIPRHWRNRYRAGRGAGPPAGDPGELVRRQRLLRSARRAPAALVRMGVRGRRQRHRGRCPRRIRRGASSILDWYATLGARRPARRGRLTAKLLRRARPARRRLGMGARMPASMLVSDDSREQGDPASSPVLRQRAPRPSSRRRTTPC